MITWKKYFILSYLLVFIDFLLTLWVLSLGLAFEANPLVNFVGLYSSFFITNLFMIGIYYVCDYLFLKGFVLTVVVSLSFLIILRIVVIIYNVLILKG